MNFTAQYLGRFATTYSEDAYGSSTYGGTESQSTTSGNGTPLRAADPATAPNGSKPVTTSESTPATPDPYVSMQGQPTATPGNTADISAANPMTLIFASIFILMLIFVAVIMLLIRRRKRAAQAQGFYNPTTRPPS